MSEARLDLRTKMLAALADVESMEPGAKGKAVTEIINGLPIDAGAKIMAQSLTYMRENGQITAQNLLETLRNFFAGVEITKEDNIAEGT